MTSPTPDRRLTRRGLLKTAWAAMGGLIVLETGGVALAYMQPRLAEGEFGGIITAGAVTDFPPGSVTHISNGRFYLSRLADGGFVALYQRCTHLGCNAPWEQVESAFVCPCHSSRFSADGSVLNPPAPRPLDTFPITIQEGMVLVYTGKPTARQTYEAPQVVYP